MAEAAKVPEVGEGEGEGAVTAPAAGGEPPDGPPIPPPAKVTVKRRLEQEGRWSGGVEHVRDDMMRQCRGRGMDKAAAQEWVYSKLDQLYPPLPLEPEAPEAPPAQEQPPASDTGQVQGLGDIPASWPELPATASLQGDLQWVQSNRLVVVEETGSGATRVHLGRAHEPAPSRAALGWLETSIRAYAKYVDVVARSLATVQDEVEHVRRERMRIDDIKALLREMGEV